MYTSTNYIDVGYGSLDKEEVTLCLHVLYKVPSTRVCVSVRRCVAEKGEGCSRKSHSMSMSFGRCENWLRRITASRVVDYPLLLSCWCFRVLCASHLTANLNVRSRGTSGRRAETICCISTVSRIAITFEPPCCISHAALPNMALWEFLTVCIVLLI